MTKDEALKLALEALEANHFLIHGSETKGGLAFCMDGYYSGCFDIDSNDKQTNEAITAIKEALAQPEQEPVGKLQEATAERAWFTIAELNAWADKKLSENPHWVMPKDEPERDEPPPQREWVGLTDEEIPDIYVEGTAFFHGVKWAEARLKEKNT